MNDKKMIDVLIVGAGTAGLTAAIYALRAGRTVQLFEESIQGGQIINTSKIENFPGFDSIAGFEFAEALYNQAIKFGTEFVYEQVLGIKDYKTHKSVVTENGEHFGKTIILATGAKPRPLGVSGEERFVGTGVSYCATCDGAFYKDKKVAVIGGGNTAIDDALVLSSYCEHVYLIHRSQEFTAEKHLVDNFCSKTNVTVILDTTVQALAGTQRLETIELENRLTKEKSTIAVDGVFVAIGQMPANKKFENIVELDKDGYIKAGEDCATSCPGIFAAGDGRTKKVRQLTTAAADGTIASVMAGEYMSVLLAEYK